MRFRLFVQATVCCGFLAGASLFTGANAETVESNRRPVARDEAGRFPAYDCGYQKPHEWQAAFLEAVRRGEIPDPARRNLPAPRAAQLGVPACTPTPTSDDIFPFEDSAGLLLTNFSASQLFSFMTDAANVMIAAKGDLFDFIGFWINFTPSQQLGSAFYLGIVNDVSGIGDGIYNFRASMGLASGEVQGYVMMWNINSSTWAPGTAGNANFTRLVLAQEFEHRFGMFLPNLLSGERLQGNDDICGREFHWNFKVDGQGSGMEIAEWVGSSPATRVGGGLNFNTDIPGGVWSYPDLYLMGYVSPAEMDAGSSELRYMLNSCSSPYNGPINTFTSTDIIAAAGVRSPSSATAQKDFRTGWIMIHRPGDLPSTTEIDKAVGILAQQSVDWNISTIGRGTLNNTLRACNPELGLLPVGADVPHQLSLDEIVIPAGGAQVTLELFVSDWDPDATGTLLGTLQTTLDSSGYTSGTTGSLSPLTTPDAAAGALIDNSRPDYAFVGVAGLTETVDTSTLDYEWSISAAAGGAAGTEGRRYAGTLIVNVSSDATGTFTLNLLPDPATLLLDDGGTQLLPLALVSARIRIAEPNPACELATEVSCGTVVPIDNSAISGGPDPLYSCGIQNNHDGTLWFKFTATSSSVRLLTCNSVAQDSTFAIYESPCDIVAFSEIGCSEDDGCGTFGYLGDQCVTGLTPGAEYFIQFSAWQPSDRGQYSLELICPCGGPPQGACCRAGGVCDENVLADSCTGSDAYLGDDTVCPNCDDGNVCTVDTCTPAGGCNSNGTGITGACDDGDACTTSDLCQGDAAGSCAGTDTSATDCDDGSVCTLDGCDSATGCTHDGTGITVACDDGSSCTYSDACLGDPAGQCFGTPNCELYGDVFPFVDGAPIANPVGNCLVDLDDLIVLLDAFSDPNQCAPNFPDTVNLFPCGQACLTGIVDVDDIIAGLDAFGGQSGCAHPCPGGACCLPGGSCQDWDGVPPGTTPAGGMSGVICSNAGGTYQGDGTTCANVTCP